MPDTVRTVDDQRIFPRRLQTFEAGRDQVFDEKSLSRDRIPSLISDFPISGMLDEPQCKLVAIHCFTRGTLNFRIATNESDRMCESISEGVHDTDLFALCHEGMFGEPLYRWCQMSSESLKRHLNVSHT